MPAQLPFPDNTSSSLQGLDATSRARKAELRVSHLLQDFMSLLQHTTHHPNIIGVKALKNLWPPFFFYFCDRYMRIISPNTREIKVEVDTR